MGAIELESDNPSVLERIEALRAGELWAELADDDSSPTSIEVWWPTGMRATEREVMKERLKDLGGTKLAAGGGSLPLTLTNCKALRQTFGERLSISEGLNEWALDEIDRLGAIENFSSASSDAVLSEHFHSDLPAISRVVHAYQRAGIAFLTHTRYALLADHPGLGKTLQTIGAMAEAQLTGDILVAAPSIAVATTWPDELALWAPSEECIPVMGTGPKRKKILDDLGPAPTNRRRWIIINLEMMRSEWVKPTQVRRPHKRTGKMGLFNEPGWWDHKYPQLHEREWSAFVVDESHRCLICHSATPQSQTQVRAGAGMIKVADNGMRIALSGTPFRGKPENLWGTLNWLDPKKYHAYYTWLQQWFHVLGDVRSSEGKRGNVEVAGLDETKAKLFYEDIAPIMLRRTKKEVRAELPDKLYAGTPLPHPDTGIIDENSPVGHWLEMSPKQAKAYHEIAEQAETMLDSGILVANSFLAELTRLKQFAICHGDIQTYLKDGEEAYRFLPKMPSAKFDWLVDFLDTLGINKHSSIEPDEEERKVVVASQFTSILDMFEIELNRIGIECLKVTGKVSQAQRKANKDRWQQPGGPRVFLLNTQAGGVSLTLDAADDLVFLDETWIPDEQEQVEDRIHRVSRIHQVTIHYLRTIGTVEENIAFTAGNRERLTKLLIDGQRGVNFAKALLTPIKREKAA
ncbi:DNA helicase [Gordonia phage Emianna]|uniref:DNA helicase n=2 Tax=Foxborovirus TaxID=2948710 RepID=A0A385UH12_9CAUD|nr:DNA helicase [Gordonia phage Foxboro]YP_010098960.1 DNA helicase [Gordonia phage Emianna]AYD84186.1 DNA helicase [Gordonia phage Jifall16]AYD84344.1 DNA helicase [Gordonia phage Kurt]QOP66733.1 DNA helicase [Gordonia phage NovumRegina]QOR55914.1 DNA helicase [Gordonia phage GrootJr]QZD98915.1 DNA helicase [Gordonia phage Tracker]WNM69326.1 DNA helicase [Gordonia phage Arti]